MPVIMDFINTYIMPLIKKLQEIPIEILTRDIKILAGAGGLLLLIGTVGKVIGLITSLGTLFSPAGLLLMGLGALVIIITLLIKYYDDWADALFRVSAGLLGVQKLTPGTWTGETHLRAPVEGEIGGHFQTGGIVTRPTIAMIGEGGPEAVIPLSQMGSDESLRIQKDMLRELIKFNEITSKRIARDISLGVSGLGQKA
jgi:phage-related protein